MNAICEKSMPALEAENARPTGHKILLADDDPAVRQILFRLLAGENYRVLTAANGVEALKISNTAKPDLVLLDLNMPVKDGWETFEQLSAANPMLPIVLITARHDQFCFAQAAGVGALLEKPLDFEKLLHTIRNLLEEPPEACLSRYTGRCGMFRHALPLTDNLAPTVPVWRMI